MNSVLEQVLYYFTLITPAVLTGIGLIGNTLVLFILLKKKFRKVSLFRYLSISTVFDTFNVLLAWPGNLPNYFLINDYSASCKIYQYLCYMVFQIPPWINVISSADRFVAVKYSSRFHFRNGIKFQAFIVSTVCFLLIIINVPYFLYYDIQQNGNETFCGYNPNNISIGFYLDILNALTSTIVPFILMVTSTILIARYLITQKLKLQKRNKRKFRKELQFVKVMFTMDSFYLFSNLPYCILTITYDSLGIQYFGTLGFDIVNSLSYVYSSCDFFVYLACNKLFRCYFISMISCLRRELSQTDNSISAIEI